MARIYSGKKILVGVSGSIAAFKVAGWVSTLAKAEAQVEVVMTQAATRFITPLTFSALSGDVVHTDMFAHDSGETMAHINLGRDADIIIIAPASAQTIARLAHGMADDLLSTTVLASRAPVYVCPAMNSRMYGHQATRNNLKKLVDYGYHIIEPGEGLMACKEQGQGRLPEWEDVDEIFQRALAQHDLSGQRVLVTAGPTREPLDPARFLSNRSSGKMGIALAKAAYRRGADVVLVAGPTGIETPPGIVRINVKTAMEMYNAVLEQAEAATIIIKSAAVADYRPEESFREKVKKDKISEQLKLVANPDILKELGARKKQNQVLVGFAAESANLEKEGRKKLEKKNLDMIAVNNINSESTGFETDNNQILLLKKDGAESLPFTSKDHTADLLLDRVVAYCELNNKI